MGAAVVMAAKCDIVCLRHSGRQNSDQEEKQNSGASEKPNQSHVEDFLLLRDPHNFTALRHV